MIIDIRLRNRSEPDFSIFAKGCCGGRIFQSSNGLIAYSFHPIDLKLGRMILDIRLHNRPELDFSISPRKHCVGVLLQIFISIHSL